MPIPDYILELRRAVGHRLLWLPGVSAVVTNDDGQILLGQRADNGAWSIIAGCLEPGEQPAEGVVREVYEETAVHAVPERISSVVSMAPVTYPNADRCQFVDVTFKCRAVGGEARVNDDESLAVGWFHPTALPRLDRPTRLRISRALRPDRAQAWFAVPELR